MMGIIRIRKNIHNKSLRWILTHFEFGGYYSKNGDNKSLQWISRNDEIYNIVMMMAIGVVFFSIRFI